MADGATEKRRDITRANEKPRVGRSRPEGIDGGGRSAAAPTHGEEATHESGDGA